MKNKYLHTSAAIVFLLFFTTNTFARTNKISANAVNSFFENRGQIRDQFGNPRNDIDFKLQGRSVALFIGNGQLHYQWMDTALTNNNHSTYRIDVELLGANKNADILSEDVQPYTETYYQYNLGLHGTKVQSFRKITYRNIYPNIDWVLYCNSNTSRFDGPSSGFKYDFIVHKGGNTNDIRLHYKGATSLVLDKGNLIVSSPLGNITEEAPFTYNAISKMAIASAYTLHDDIVSFRILALGEDDDIVIDPSLKWGTYYGGSVGGSGGDYGEDITTDVAGNIYLAGRTLSSNNIATAGAYKTILPSTSEVGFIVKLSPSGSRLWGTYYGGDSTTVIQSICCTGNDLYVAGETNSINGIATSGAYQTSNNGDYDGFIAKFTTLGALTWATYYGGASTDKLISVTTDKLGNIYACGGTNSTSGIAGAGSHQSLYGGAASSLSLGDGMLVKFNSLGQRQWATYYGGSNNDELDDVSCDNQGNIYACGYTNSTNAIAAGTVHQTATGGSRDAFITKFNSSGVNQWGTYYGGTGDDDAGAIYCDASGNIVIGGSTTSSANIATSSAQQTTYGGGIDAYLVKLSSSGGRIWGTYIGGSGYEGIIGIAGDSAGNILCSGHTTSTNNISTANGFRPGITNANPDIFWQLYNSSGAKTYGTYYGGTNYDVDAHIAWHYSGNIYLCGFTNSTVGISAGAGHQLTFGGGVYDAFVVNFITDTLAYFPLPYIDTLFCAGDSVHIAYAVNSKFSSSNVFTLQLSNSTGSFASPIIIGSKSSDTAGVIHGRIPVNTTGGNGYRLRIVGSAPNTTSSTDGIDINIKPVAAGFSASSNTPICAGDTLRLYGAATTPGLTWNWSGPVSFTSISKDTVIANAQSNRAGDYVLTATLNGCAIRDTETIAVKLLPAKPNAGSNTPLCAGSNLNLTASTTTSGVSWNWTGPGSFSSTAQNPVRTSVTTADAGNYIVSAILNGCASKDTEAVVINSIPPAPSVGSNSPLCTGNTLNLTASPVSSASYSWTGPAGFSSAIQNPSRVNVQLSHAGIYSVTATVNGCTSPAGTTNVVISAGPSVSIYVNPNDTICTGGNATFVAIPTNGGTAPQYKWYRNSSFTGVVTASYPVTAPTNGDVFYCELTNNTTCAVPASSNSNSITLTVLPNVTPSVTVTANPTGPVPPFQLISFTATPVNGGGNPQYQWIRNGTNITGATAATWGATTLSNQDAICVLLTSSEKCPNPKTVKSNCMTIEILTGVEHIASESYVQLWPNPNRGSFTISAASLPENRVYMGVENLLGQTIRQWNKAITGGELRENVQMLDLAPGMYVLKIQVGNLVQTIRFMVNK